MTPDEEAKQEWRNAEWQRLKAEGRAMNAEVDALLATRKDPSDLETWSNIIRFEQKVKPLAPPPGPIITGMIDAVRQETANGFAMLRAEVSGDLEEIYQYIGKELTEVLTETFGTIADEFEHVRLDVKALQAKGIESDVSKLEGEVASLRNDLSSLQSIVGNLAAEVSALRDDIAAVERNGAGKVIALR